MPKARRMNERRPPLAGLKMGVAQTQDRRETRVIPWHALGDRTASLRVWVATQFLPGLTASSWMHHDTPTHTVSRPSSGGHIHTQAWTPTHTPTPAPTPQPGLAGCLAAPIRRICAWASGYGLGLGRQRREMRLSHHNLTGRAGLSPELASFACSWGSYRWCVCVCPD